MYYGFSVRRLGGATLVKNAGFVKGAGCPNSCRVGGIQPLSRREPAPTREGLGLQPLTRRQVFQLGKGWKLNPCQEGGGLQLVKGRGRNPCQEDVCQNAGDPAPKWSSLQTLQLVKGVGAPTLTRERFGGRCPCQKGQAGNPCRKDVPANPAFRVYPLYHSVGGGGGRLAWCHSRSFN